jgi:hypothetical protein
MGIARVVAEATPMNQALRSAAFKVGRTKSSKLLTAFGSVGKWGRRGGIPATGPERPVLGWQQLQQLSVFEIKKGESDQIVRLP